MKKWNEIVLEHFNNYIQEDQSESISIKAGAAAGSSLYKELTLNQHKKLVNKLSQINMPQIKEILKELKDSDDYTRSVIVYYKDLKFSLYGNDNRLRIGSGGPLSSTSTLNNKLDIDDFIDDLDPRKI